MSEADVYLRAVCNELKRCRLRLRSHETMRQKLQHHQHYIRFRFTFYRKPSTIVYRATYRVAQKVSHYDKLALNRIKARHCG